MDCLNNIRDFKNYLRNDISIYLFLSTEYFLQTLKRIKESFVTRCYNNIVFTKIILLIGYSSICFSRSSKV